MQTILTKFIPFRIESKMSLHYKDQSINFVFGNKATLSGEAYEI
jgi:hypothetical protein